MGKGYAFDEGAPINYTPGFTPTRPPQETPHYIARTRVQIIEMMSSVSEQPGIRQLYTTYAEHTKDRTLTPQDAAGTLVIDVAVFAEGADVLIKTVYHTMIQDWLTALYGDNPNFLGKAVEFYTHVLMGTVAMAHMSQEK